MHPVITISTIPTTPVDDFDGIPVLCQSRSKMTVLGVSHSEGELGIDEVHLNLRVLLGVVGGNLQDR